MIIIVDALNAQEYSELLDQMFRLRARVFAGRLGWEVSVKDGKEIDQFDALDPAYVIGVDDEGQVVSCVRALQTTGPHMLSDVFSAILHGEPPLRSATLWESTRFCVDTQRLGRGRGPNTVSYATSELMIGSLEFCRDAGISDIVTVIDPVMDRVLKRSDCAPYGYVGKTTPMGKVPAMAALLDTSDERTNRLRAFAGIEGDVFADEAARKRLADKPVQASPAEALIESALSTAQIADYLREQLRDSSDQDELEATRSLVRRIAESEGFGGIEDLLEDTRT